MSAPPEEAHGGMHRAAAAELQAEIGRFEAERERRALQIGAPLEDRQEAVLRDRPFLPVVEEQGQLERQGAAIEPPPELDHHRQGALHVARSAPEDAAVLAAGREVTFLDGHGVEVPGEQHGWARAAHATADDRVPDPLPGSLAGHVRGDLRFFPDGAADLAELERALREIHQTGTPKSRSAELSEVLRSVLSLRVPMIRAQGVRYSPAG